MMILAQDLKDALLDLGDFNIIVTSWGGFHSVHLVIFENSIIAIMIYTAEGSQPHFYPQAVMNLRVVGLEIAFLLNAIVRSFFTQIPV